MKALFVGLGCLSVVLSVNAIIEKGVDFNTLVNGTIHNSHTKRAPGWKFEGWGISGYISNSQLASLSRNPDTMEFFFVERNLEGWWPRHRYWNVGQSSWMTERFGGNRVWSADQAPAIAAVSRTSERMDMFYLSSGDILHWKWQPGAGWSNAGSVGQTSKIRLAAVSRHSNHLEIFYGGNGGLLQSYSGDGGATWTKNVRLLASSPSIISIAAVSRHDNHQEVFWVDEGGNIKDAYWNSSTGWGFKTLLLASDGRAPDSSTSIAAGSRSSGRMNIFYIGKNRKVYQGWWSDQTSIWKLEVISNDASAAPGGIAWTSMHAGHQEIFWTKTDGTLMHAYWTEGAATWSVEAVPISEKCFAGGSIAVVARAGKGSMEGSCMPKSKSSELIHFWYYSA